MYVFLAGFGGGFLEEFVILDSQVFYDVES